MSPSKVPAEEVRALCPRYFHVSREEKKAFWALLFASIARLESGFDPENTFMEPRPLRTLSVGLLQLSYGDQERHAGCPLEPMEAPILSGKKLCFVSILRAGDGILEGMLELVPSARVGSEHSASKRSWPGSWMRASQSTSSANGPRACSSLASCAMSSKARPCHNSSKTGSA